MGIEADSSPCTSVRPADARGGAPPGPPAVGASGCTLQRPALTGGAHGRRRRHDGAAGVHPATRTACTVLRLRLSYKRKCALGHMARGASSTPSSPSRLRPGRALLGSVVEIGRGVEAVLAARSVKARSHVRRTAWRRRGGESTSSQVPRRRRDPVAALSAPAQARLLCTSPSWKWRGIPELCARARDRRGRDHREIECSELTLVDPACRDGSGLVAKHRAAHGGTLATAPPPHPGATLLWAGAEASRRRRARPAAPAMADFECVHETRCPRKAKLLRRDARRLATAGTGIVHLSLAFREPVRSVARRGCAADAGRNAQACRCWARLGGARARAGAAEAAPPTGATGWTS